MRKKILSTIILITLSVMPSFTSGPATLQKSSVDWTKGYVTSRGAWEIPFDMTGKPEDPHDRRPVSLNRARMTGYEKAKELAMEMLSREIQNIVVENDVALKDYLEDDSTVQFRLSKLFETGVKLLRYPVDFQTSGCEARLKISDLLSIFPFEYPSGDFPTYHRNPISTEYTGLIIDARRLKIQPMLFPAIYNEDGLEIYSRLFVDMKTAGRDGIVSYAFSDDEASRSGRGGPRPYYAVALKKYNGSPVISLRDARKILSSGTTLQNLKKCRVIFIVDRA